MATVVKLYGVLLIQIFLLTNVFAQYQIQNIPRGPQIQNAPCKHSQPPLINSLMSTYASNVPFVEKLNAIAAVIQKLPPKNPGIVHKRIYMAEALKKTALESLMYAANACKSSKQAEGRIPLRPLKPQMTVGNDVLANRAVNVRYDRYV